MSKNGRCLEDQVGELGDAHLRDARGTRCAGGSFDAVPPGSRLPGWRLRYGLLLDLYTTEKLNSEKQTFNYIRSLWERDELGFDRHDGCRQKTKRTSFGDWAAGNSYWRNRGYL